jgi:hypothetical protein
MAHEKRGAGLRLGGSMRDLDLLTMADVAALMKCSRAHVTNLVAGRVRGCVPLPAIHMGRRLLVRPETLMMWIESNERDKVQQRKTA